MTKRIVPAHSVIPFFRCFCPRNTQYEVENTNAPYSPSLLHIPNVKGIIKKNVYTWLYKNTLKLLKYSKWVQVISVFGQRLTQQSWCDRPTPYMRWQGQAICFVSSINPPSPPLHTKLNPSILSKTCHNTCNKQNDCTLNSLSQTVNMNTHRYLTHNPTTFRTVKAAVDEMLFQKECLSITFMKNKQCRNNATVRHVRATIVAVEKQ